MPRRIRPIVSATAFLGLFLTCAGDPTGNTLPPGDVDVHLEQVATGLDFPLLVTAAPGDTGRLFVVEKGGTVRVLKHGVAARHAVYRPQRARHQGQRAGAPRHGVPSHRRPRGAQLHHPRATGRRALAGGHVHGRRRSRRARSGQRAAGARSGPALQQPQRRARGVRAGRVPLLRPRRRRERRRPAGLRPAPGRPAGFAPAARPRPRASLHRPGLEPVRRAGRHARRALELGAPQSLALQLRPRQRRPLHGRRRPGRLGRSGRAARRPARGGDNYGWNIMEGDHCYGRRELLPRRGSSCRSPSTATAMAAPSPAVSCTADRPSPNWRAPTSTATTATDGSAASGTKAAPATEQLSWPSLDPHGQVSSFGEDASGELYVVLAGGTIYRIAPGN